jgi:hypothetical protein
MEAGTLLFFNSGICTSRITHDTLGGGKPLLRQVPIYISNSPETSPKARVISGVTDYAVSI